MTEGSVIAVVLMVIVPATNRYILIITQETHQHSERRVMWGRREFVCIESEKETDLSKVLTTDGISGNDVES